ncbi:hypothetical protein PVK06_040806 [Gossypium arboreum]|uniref:Uncharacterized protein n=1 Tax=Gossypium arboreum TaxID=29729 RepID=A0ABR0N6H9_GOSAR|nr:hypothetical protein PVK06_040806 [Gossypium arboreum]
MMTSPRSEVSNGFSKEYLQGSGENELSTMSGPEYGGGKPSLAFTLQRLVFICHPTNLFASLMAMGDVPVVDTPRHSLNTWEAVHSQDNGGVVLQKDKFLASWLLSTITNDVLVYLIKASTSFEVWITIERKFSAKSSVKISSMCHAFYSLKKVNLTIKEYLFKVKSMNDSLITAGSMVVDQEQVSIILVGLSMEYESIRVFASATSVSLDLLTELLLDCEERQLALLTEVPMQANLASHLKQDGAI